MAVKLKILNFCDRLMGLEKLILNINNENRTAKFGFLDKIVKEEPTAKETDYVFSADVGCY